MKIKKKYLFIVPARKSSKRVKNKNIKKIKNKPLYYWTLKELKILNKKNDCVVTTDSNEILKGAKKNGFIGIKRPSRLATDKSKIIETIKYLLKKFENKNIYYENIVLLQVTSPLRKLKDIKTSMKLYEKKKCDTLFSVFQLSEKYKNNIFYSNLTDSYLKKKKIKNFSKIFVMNGPAILISKSSNIYRNKLYGKKICYYKMPYENSIDINYEYEFKMCEKLL